jgi:hypothetical protein
MKHTIALSGGIIMAVLLCGCNNFFHDLIPPDDTLILSFEVEGQLGAAVISEDTVTVIVEKGSAVNALVPRVQVSYKATLLPVTFDYISAAFPSADMIEAAMQMHESNNDNEYLLDLIKANPDFNVPAISMPIDFTGPVAMLVVGGLGSTRQYTVYIAEDSGEPRLLNLRFSKYDNAELMSDAVCVIDEAAAAVYANAVYPAEMGYLSYALIPSFRILGDGFDVDGNRIVSGVDPVQFIPSLGLQTKTITVTRDGANKDYTLTIFFSEDPDTVRSITDFRFNKADNPGIAANAVAAIINTDNTGTITVQVYYSGAKPQTLTPRFISPCSVSVGGVTQTSGVNSRDFSSPVEYRVVSKNGMYSRVYTVKVEFINITESAPRITAFRFSAALNAELVQDAAGKVSDGLILIDAHYGGPSAPTGLMPEFSAGGLVTVYGSVQVSGASAQDFTRQVKYTVTNPLNPNLFRDYWVQCRMLQDSSSYAAITSFGFYPEDNPGLAGEMIGKIDQINGKITVYASPGSGVTDRVMIPRFTAAGQVSAEGTAQVSGVSGRVFDAPVIYTVVSANGNNRREYVVSVRELKSPLYVNCNASGHGDGSSWENAFTSLKTACEAAAEFPETMTKEIWIAAGTYTPGKTPEDYFPLSSNTGYIGGFAGYETSKSQRNVAANTVIISGDLGGGLNAQRLFSTPYTVIIDGSYGLLNYAMINGDLIFENLHLRNTSRMTSTPGLIISDRQGEGIYIRNLTGNVKINGISLQDINGYGMYCNGTLSSVEVSNSNINNITYNNAIYINNADDIVIDRVNIDGVSNSNGNGMFISKFSLPSSTVRISNSNIRNCERTGIYINDYFSTVYENTVVENCREGGVVVNKGSSFTMNSGKISNNINSGSGWAGGVSVGGTFTMNGGTISDNTGNGGGGVFTFVTSDVDNIHYYGNFIMKGGTISGNKAIYIGANITDSMIGGGGVNLYEYGTINKTGGTIYGNDGTANANMALYSSGALINNRGHAVYKYRTSQYRDTTLGPSDNLSW